MIRRRLTGLLASLLILALLAGLPSVLLAVGGTPVPGHGPTLTQVGDWLTRPDDGTVALHAITVAGWLVWLLLGITLIGEIVAAIRGITAPTLPALRAPQLAVRQLVAAAALLFISAQSLADTPTAYADDPATPQPAAAPADATTQLPHAATRVSITHVVGPADTLSGLARTYLGDSTRWPEIFQASRDLIQPDGRQLTNPDLIRNGWILTIPVATITNTKGTQLIDHVVGPADTLSGLARTYLGDGTRWPEIFQASRDLVQTDGQQLTHPDLLLPGWHLRIPAPSAAADVPRAPAPPTPPGSYTAPQPPASQQITSPPPDARAAGDATPAPPASRAPSSTAAPPTTPASQQPPAPPAAPDPPGPGADTQAPMDAPWLLTGLTTGGLILAAAALLALRSRRRQQGRHRHPGRAIAAPEPRLSPVEKTITAVGAPAAPTLHFVDDALRRLAASLLADQQPMPTLIAVELSADGSMVLHLAEPAHLGAPWIAQDAASLSWQIPAGTSVAAIGGHHDGQPAPYPLLVTCGCTEAGGLWLVNLEHLGAVRVTGSPDYRRDYLRYVVAELALNPWASTTITCVGLDDLTALNPERIHVAALLDAAAEHLTGQATVTAEAATRLGADTATARAAHLAEDVWGAHVLVADADSAEVTPGVSGLIDVIAGNPGRTSAAVISSGAVASRAIDVEFTGTGRVMIPDLGLDLVAVGLTSDEALGCAALLSVGTATQDVPVPADDGEEGWRGLADRSGALRDHLTVPRSTPGTEPAGCVIAEDMPLPDSAVEADLAVLDPKVPDTVRTVVEQTDPHLDDDVADWFAADCARPRLTLLGPVMVRAHGTAIAKRKPFYTEVLSYLALREQGATPDELATALGYTNPTTVRTAVTTVRDWLGANPRTGRPHLPAATDSPAAQQRGIAVYQVDDGLLVDVDLFRRLRLRGQAHGADGIDDLVTALSLVTGRPFDRLRPGGWSWLADTGVDHHMVCAIVDVAHLLTVHFFQAGDLDRARAATETALRAAPYDEIPKLDLAAILKAEGHLEEARRLINEDICNLPDDDGLPAEIGDRTHQILTSDDWSWLQPGRAVP